MTMGLQEEDGTAAGSFGRGSPMGDAQATNAQLRAILPLVDLHLSPVAAWSQGALLSRARALMLAKLKQPFWLAGLRATRKTTAKKFDLKLSRSRATKFRTRHEHRAADNGGDAHAVASMADHQGRLWCSPRPSAVDSRDPAALCVGPNDEGNNKAIARLGNTMFMGERGNDAGGLYRETWSEFAAELETPFLLPVPTPNNRSFRASAATTTR